MARTFVEQVGGTFLAGRAVMAYRDGDDILLVAETSAGGPLRRLVDDEGGKRWLKVRDRRVSPDAFESLKSLWGHDAPSSRDVRITERALAWMGVA